MIFKLKQYFKSFLIFKQKLLIFLIILPFFIYLIGFLAYLFVPRDPDLWWHLQVGKDILEKGFNYRDIYSYAMPGFEWVDHEWLLNIIFYLLFTIGHNFLLLGLFFIFITFIAFYTVGKSSLKHFDNYITAQFSLWFGLFLALISLEMNLSIRAQIIGILGLSILWQILRKNNWFNLKNIKWFLAVFFLIWANLHGSFIIGLAVLGLDFCLDLFDIFVLKDEDKKQDLIKQIKTKFIIGILCFLVTFINPYFYKTYLEAWRVFSDHYAHHWIDEWKSPNLKQTRYIYWLSYTLTLVLLLIYKKAWQKLSKLEICSLIIFIILAFRSVRHISLFSIIALPIYISLLENFLEDFNIYLKSQIYKFKIKKVYIISTFIIFSLISSLLICLKFTNKNVKRFLNYSFKQEFYYKDYPEKALDFLQTQKFKGNILAEYGWGGFILWYSPSYKVFIDGRMPNWPFKNHKTILQVFNELRFPKAFDGGSINKYQIEYVLLKKTKNHTKKTYFNWPIVYQDSKSVILKNPNFTTSI